MPVMQEALRIGVLGHREALLRAIRGLAVEQDGISAGSWPASPQATLTVAQAPLLQVQQQRERLLRELDRAQTRLAALDM